MEQNQGIDFNKEKQGQALVVFLAQIIREGVIPDKDFENLVTTKETTALKVLKKGAKEEMPTL